MEEKVTRGTGLLEGFLAKRRYAMARSLLPEKRGSLLDLGGGRGDFIKTTDFIVKYTYDSRDGEDINKYVFNPFFTYNCITMLAVWEHLEPNNLPRICKEIHRSLKPQGRFIITTPAWWTQPILDLMAKINLVSKEEIEEHRRLYTRKAIEQMLTNAGFSNVFSGTFELGLNTWVVGVK